jgi:hypothetical protein
MARILSARAQEAGRRARDAAHRARPGLRDGRTPALKPRRGLPIPLGIMPSIRRTLTAALLTGAATLAAASTAPAADAPVVASGRIEVEWDKVVKGARPYARALRRSGAIERVAAAVNDRYALPDDIPIVFSSQIEQGPAYFPDVRIDGRRMSFIHFPGSFLQLEVAIMRRELRGVKVLRPIPAMIYANEFVVAHELGHALVHQLDLPVTGKEEDAVDGFAAYLLANTRGFGPRSALAAAVLFDGLSHTPSDEDYADEHSLSQQRVYQFLCWIYGSDRRAFRSIVGKDGLPRARAVRCAAEWKQLNNSWTRLMEPYLKTRQPNAGGGDTMTTPPSQAVPPAQLSVPGLLYEPATRMLSANGRGTQVRELDGAVLALLMRNPGRQLTRAQFLAEIPALTGNGALGTAVRTLRRYFQLLGWSGRLYGSDDGAKLVV